MNIWPWNTIRRLRDALADAKQAAKTWETAYYQTAEFHEDALARENELITLLNDRRREVASLTAQLDEAQRNDTRDPMTGRFVKAER